MLSTAAPASEAHSTAPTIAPQFVQRWLPLAIALLLSLVWIVRDWAELSALWLPDNDDMARLTQVRDWIAGQGFNDLLQYRFGLADGASMHWSRAADVGIALPIVLLTPLIGQYHAELVAVSLYPAALFFAYLVLIGRLAVHLGGPVARVPATLLAAIAFPTISLFLPGRIDHHGLQIVLTILLLETAIAPPTLRRGVIGGVAAAVSLSIGLEVAPEIVAVLAVLGIAWLRDGKAEDQRLLGFALALGGTTLALLAFARPTVWPEAWCDGFTPASSRATLVLAGALLTLALAGRRFSDWRARLALGGAVGAVTVTLVFRTSSVCLTGPYGALDPFLQRVWMSNVNEANGLWRQDAFGTPIAYAGLIFAGTILSLVKLRGDGRWLGFALFMLLGAVATALQIRVAYILAGIAVVPFAVSLVRAEGLGRRLALWVCGAGIGWALLASVADRAMAGPITAALAEREKCVSIAGTHVIAAEPAGRIMTPLSLSAYVMTATHHRVIPSLYHRNNPGNMAMYRFFMASPDRARALAQRYDVTLVALCNDDLREEGIQPYRRGSLAAALQAGGTVPDWLEPVPTGSAIRLYRVR